MEARVYSHKKFCNENCEKKYAYAIHFNKTEKLIEHSSTCLFCNEEIHTKGIISKKFCNRKCAREFLNQTRRQKTIDKSISKEPIIRPKKKGISYSELNRRAEWKRLNEDESWLYRSNRDKI